MGLAIEEPSLRKDWNENTCLLCFALIQFLIKINQAITSEVMMQKGNGGMEHQVLIFTWFCKKKEYSCLHHQGMEREQIYTSSSVCKTWGWFRKRSVYQWVHTGLGLMARAIMEPSMIIARIGSLGFQGPFIKGWYRSLYLFLINWHLFILLVWWCTIVEFFFLSFCYFSFVKLVLFM